MERYENGFRMSEDQATALSEAFGMVNFVKHALQKIDEADDLDVCIVIDGLFPMIQDIDRRLMFAVLGDTE